MSRETKFAIIILSGMLVSLVLLLSAFQLASKPMPDSPPADSPRDVALNMIFDAYTVNFYETSNPNSAVAHRQLTKKLAAICRSKCDQALLDMVDRLRSLGGEK